MNCLVQLGPNKSIKSNLLKPKVLIGILGALSSPGLLPAENVTKPRLLVISLDGFPAYYLDSNEIESITPNLQSFKKRSQFLKRVSSVYPTLTYPAHTSMVTGVDPEQHGIYSNTPLDPFDKNDSGWMWYDSDIGSKTIWKYAKESRVSTASLLWPVTVGNRQVDYLIPQFWRKKNAEDSKLLDALSSPGLLPFLERETGISISETSPDKERFSALRPILRNKEIQLIFLYTTDLDTAHHGYGVFSEEAKAKLKEWDLRFGEILDEWEKSGGKEAGLILVSDHGFAASQTTCSPNVYGLQKGWIDLASESYDFIFKSNGGSGYLLSGKRKEMTASEEESMKLDLETQCPGLQILKRKKPLYPKTNSPLVLFDFVTQKGMVFSSTKKGALFSNLTKPSFGHGHDPEREDMKTILGFQGTKNLSTNVSSIKDVFWITCEFFSWDCKTEAK